MWSRSDARRRELTLAGQFLAAAAGRRRAAARRSSASCQRAAVDRRRSPTSGARRCARWPSTSPTSTSSAPAARLADGRSPGDDRPGARAAVDRGAQPLRRHRRARRGARRRRARGLRPPLVGSPADLGDSDVLRGRGWTGDVDARRRARRRRRTRRSLDDRRRRCVGVVVGRARPTRRWGAAHRRGARPRALPRARRAARRRSAPTCVSRVVKRRTRGLAPDRDRQPGRPPRGAAAQHPRGRRRGRHRRPGHDDERRRPGDRSACRTTRSGGRSPTSASTRRSSTLLAGADGPDVAGRRGAGRHPGGRVQPARGVLARAAASAA